MTTSMAPRSSAPPRSRTDCCCRERISPKSKGVRWGGAAGPFACVDLLVEMGLPVANVTLTDIKGVVYQGRDKDMPPNMARYARKTDARTLGEVLAGADVFLGLSAPNV